MIKWLDWNVFWFIILRLFKKITRIEINHVKSVIVQEWINQSVKYIIAFQRKECFMVKYRYGLFWGDNVTISLLHYTDDINIFTMRILLYEIFRPNP